MILKSLILKCPNYQMKMLYFIMYFLKQIQQHGQKRNFLLKSMENSSNEAESMNFMFKKFISSDITTFIICVNNWNMSIINKRTSEVLNLIILPKIKQLLDSNVAKVDCFLLRNQMMLSFLLKTSLLSIQKIVAAHVMKHSTWNTL